MLIELKNIQKTYSAKNGVTYRALNNVSTSFDGKGLVYLVGASGSGKSTLLNVIGGLDSYDSGELSLAGKRMNELKNSEVDSLRNTLMGFVFQEFNLIDTLSVFDNVKLALDMQSRKDDNAVMNALEEMGIADKAKNKTKDLSGGQRQRVAIARAIVKNPRMILADEPTGSLDSATSEEVISILKKMSETRLVIVVTHDMDTAVKTGDRIIEMKDGRIYRDVRRKKDGEVIEMSQAEMYSDTLMVVPKSREVSGADVEKINDVLTHAVGKTYINVESDTRKVKALFPNLREAVSSDKPSSSAVEDAGALSAEEFVPYKGADGEKETVEFKKSRLGFLQAVKLAFNNLNFKKVRLVITVIVAFIAFSLFGVSQSFANYDLRAAVTKTLQKDGETCVAVAPSDTDFYDFLINNGNVHIGENQFIELQKADENVAYVRQYAINVPLPEGIIAPSRAILKAFTGIVETDNAESFGKKIIYGKGTFDSDAQTVISEYAARSLAYVGAFGAHREQDLIGKVLDGGNGFSFEIVGIFECENIERWLDDDDLTDYTGSLAREMLVSGGWGQLYVRDGVARKYFSSALQTAVPLDTEISVDGMKSTSASSVVYFDVSDSVSVIPVANGGKIENAGDMIVSSALLDSLETEGVGETEEEKRLSVAASLNADSSRRLVFRDNVLGAVHVSDSFRIVGIADSETSAVAVHDSVKEDLLKALMRPSVLYADIAQTSAKSFVNAVYNNGFIIVAPSTVMYDTAKMVIDVLSGILLAVALIFCALVVLLLFSFISTSIRLTRKQIGILRALGARKIDTFMIYALEGVLVTLLSLVIAVICISAGAPALNAIISVQSGFWFALFTVTAPVYLTMTAVAVAVTLLSVIIPLRKFNKITPVSAIGGKV